MWGGHLGRTSVTKRRIQLSKDTATTHSHQFLAGPRQLQLEKDKVDKIVKGNLAKPATTE